MPEKISAPLVGASKPRLDRPDESYLAIDQRHTIFPRRVHNAVGKPRRPALVLTPTSSFVIALNSFGSSGSYPAKRWRNGATRGV